jgi:hypothetical protein
MTKRVSAKAVAKAVDKRIDEVYRKHCAGMQIDVMRIGGLFHMARKMIAAHCDDATLGASMVAYVHSNT